MSESNQVFICCDCGEEYDEIEDNMEEYENELYCLDCMPTFDCCECGDDYYMSVVNEYEGNQYCVDCYSQIKKLILNDILTKYVKEETKQKIIEELK